MTYIQDTKKYTSLQLNEIVGFLKIIAEPNRLMILSVLQEGPLNVGQIQERLKMPLNLTSFHLRPLKKAGLINAKKTGLNIYYSVNESKVCSYREFLNTFLCERCSKEGLHHC
jgi:DNA-binding transcriptional ArsR family regulator